MSSPHMKMSVLIKRNLTTHLVLFLVPLFLELAVQPVLLAPVLLLQLDLFLAVLKRSVGVCE